MLQGVGVQLYQEELHLRGQERQGPGEPNRILLYLKIACAAQYGFFLPQ